MNLYLHRDYTMLCTCMFWGQVFLLCAASVAFPFAYILYLETFLLCVCLCLSVTYIEEKEKIKKTEGVCVWGERKPQKV